jgi:hypothetical protein
MMKTTFEGQVRNNLRAYPHWRYGQALFNSLMDLRPEWAEEIRGTDKDPFYAGSDSLDSRSRDRLAKFYEWLDARTF